MFRLLWHIMSLLPHGIAHNLRLICFICLEIPIHLSSNFIFYSKCINLALAQLPPSQHLQEILSAMKVQIRMDWSSCFSRRCSNNNNNNNFFFSFSMFWVSRVIHWNSYCSHKLYFNLLWMLEWLIICSIRHSSSSSTSPSSLESAECAAICVTSYVDLDGASTSVSY